MRLPLLLACTLLLPSAAPAAARILEVPRDWPSIQAGIDAAPAHALVLVAPGLYRECLQLRGRPVSLVAPAGPERTRVDAGGACTVLTIDRGEGRDTRVEGFTLSGGRHATHAGGIHVEGASPVLRANHIHANVGGPLGHGITLSGSAAALLEANRVSANASLPGAHGAGGGGGIGVHGEGRVELLRNHILDNSSAHSAGGGLLLVNAGAVQVIGNQIAGNRARLAGGGIAVLGRSGARIENNLIVANRVVEPGQGGGLHWLLLAGSNPLRLVGNTLAANLALLGAALHVDGADADALIANNLLLADEGTATVACGDFLDDRPPAFGINRVAGAAPAFAGLCERTAGAGPAPRFLPGGWQLAAGSPGIDAGDARASAEKLDADGCLRVQDGNGDGLSHIDLGAFEAPAL